MPTLRPRPRGALPVLLLALLAPPACARPAPPDAPAPLVTDRPDFTESAEVVPRGRVQIEAGTTVAAAGDVRSAMFGEILLRAGVAPRLELRLDAGSWAVPDLDAADGGLDDIGIGAKLSLLDGSGMRPTLALIAGTSLPTGHEAVGSGAAVPEATLAAAWSLSPAVGLSANLNWALPDDDGRFTEYGASASLARSLGERTGAYAEWFAILPQRRGLEAEHFANVGLTRLLSPDLQLDLRVGTGMGGESGRWFVGAGFARRW